MNSSSRSNSNNHHDKNNNINNGTAVNDDKKNPSLTSRRQTVQATLDAAHRDDVQVLGPAVVAAVHDRGHGQTEGHAVLVALGTGAP